MCTMERTWVLLEGEKVLLHRRTPLATASQGREGRRAAAALNGAGGGEMALAMSSSDRKEAQVSIV